jgi:hypothetical protein
VRENTPAWAAVVGPGPNIDRTWLVRGRAKFGAHYFRYSSRPRALCGPSDSSLYDKYGIGLLFKQVLRSFTWRGGTKIPALYQPYVLQLASTRTRVLAYKPPPPRYRMHAYMPMEKEVQRSVVYAFFLLDVQDACMHSDGIKQF